MERPGTVTKALRRTSAALPPLPRASAALRRRFSLALSSRPAPTPGDPGLFGPASASWQLLGDVAALAGGLQAVLLQSQHPAVMAAVVDHSVFRDDPLGRLRRTGSFVNTVTFGPTDQALATCARLVEVHGMIRFTHAGRTLTAADPWLTDFVHCTLVQALLACDLAYAADPLGPADRDRFVAEQAQVARLLGDPDPPCDVAGLTAHMDDHSTDLVLSAQCRDAVGFLARPPLPLPLSVAYPVLWRAALASMDPTHRDRLRLPAPRRGTGPSTLSMALLRAALGPRTYPQPAVHPPVR